MAPVKILLITTRSRSRLATDYFILKIKQRRRFLILTNKEDSIWSKINSHNNFASLKEGDFTNILIRRDLRFKDFDTGSTII